MSTSITAITVIGLAVPTDKLLRKVKIKQFEHDYPENFAYCPESGVRLWRETHLPINGYDDSTEQIFGYNVYHYRYDNKMVIGLDEFVSKIEPYMCVLGTIALNGTVLIDYKSKMKVAMGALWQENQFGVHTLLLND